MIHIRAYESAAFASARPDVPIALIAMSVGSSLIDHPWIAGCTGIDSAGWLSHGKT